MKLMIVTPGTINVEEGTQRALVEKVKGDLEKRNVPRAHIKRHLYSLGIMAGGIGATTLTDSSGNLIASYRITR